MPSDEKRCTVPPEGWWCSRAAGHEGPCAATPDTGDRLVDLIRSWLLSEDHPVSQWERDFAAAIRTQSTSAGEAVAWRYTGDDGSVELVLDCNGEYARRLIELGYTETPLFTALTAAPATQDAGVLREALPYLQHKSGCRMRAALGQTCVCGFENLSERILSTFASLSPATPQEQS